MKSISKIFVALLFAGFICTAQVEAQQLDTLVSRFRHFRTTTLQEKVYAHLDRNFYLTGETMWFKIYIVDGSFHAPLGLSRVAYVEVLDASGFRVLEAKIAMSNGLGSGSFFIPATLTSGYYRVRAYTNWMKNFSADFYYEQTITIVNPFLSPEPPAKRVKQAHAIEFFPEGGHLLAGVENKVGFRITHASDRTELLNGAIINDSGDTVASLRPGVGGIGSFVFTPSPSHRYRAVVSDAEGGQAFHPVPNAETEGYAMQLQETDDALEVQVTARNVDASRIFLFVHARQIITSAEAAVLRRNRATFVIPKNKLSEGISHFTLFDDALQPVAERLYFTWPHKKLHIDISANQRALDARKKVSVRLQTKKEDGKTIAAHLSMAVFRLDSLSSVTPPDIFTHLWLDADLTGEMASPQYYFNGEDQEVRQAMDNLMLTHGWRRFKWTELGQRKEYRFLPEARGHIVNVGISREGEKQRSVFSYLAAPGKIIRLYGSWSNDDGLARFEVKDLYGPKRLIIQTGKDSATRYDMKIENPFSPGLPAAGQLSWSPAEEDADALLARSIAMQVQDIFYYDSFGTKTIEPVVDSLAFYGKADATYYLDDYTRFPVMEEVMREYVPGVFVRKRKDGFDFVVIDESRRGVLSGDPMVLLDGVPILDVDDIMAMDPLRVEKLEVVKRQYFLGQAVFSGIVSYSTYEGDLGGMTFDPSTLSLNYEGLQLRREFYSPRYSRQQELDRKPDQRHLLYWAPEIHTDDSGEHALEFFTSDVPGTYMIVVQGLDDDGHVGSNTLTFTVSAPDHP